MIIDIYFICHTSGKKPQSTIFLNIGKSPENNIAKYGQSSRIIKLNGAKLDRDLRQDSDKTSLRMIGILLAWLSSNTKPDVQW